MTKTNKRSKLTLEKPSNPYFTRSRGITATSFVYFSEVSVNHDHFKFLEIDQEFIRLRNPKEDELMHCFFANINKDPKTFKEAMQIEEKDKWLEAVNEELKSMDKNQVWRLVNRPTQSSDGEKPNIIGGSLKLKPKKMEVRK